jgi:hypothetical protein
MKLVGGGECAGFIRFDVVCERIELFDGDSLQFPAKTVPAATCFPCFVERMLTYWRGLEHSRLVAGGLGVGILVRVARASWLNSTFAMRVMSVDSNSATVKSDSLLLGRGRKLMVRERGSSVGVAYGPRLVGVLLSSLGDVRCIGEALDGEARAAEGSLLCSR